MTVQPSLRAALKKLVENPRLSVKQRLSAFTRLQQLGVPTALLERLLRDRKLPVRLLSAVTTAYDARLEIQRWKREQKRKTAAPNVLGIRPDLSD